MLRTQIVGLAAMLCLTMVACIGDFTSPDGMRKPPSTTADSNSVDAIPFDPLAPEAYVPKVKLVLTGKATTSDELKAVKADPTAMATLVDTWMTDDAFRVKMLAFFKLAFQQNSQGADLTDQAGDVHYLFPALDNRYDFSNMLSESFPRTAWEIVQANQPFNSVLTTHDFMMTTAQSLLYAFADDVTAPDVGRGKLASSRLLIANPSWTLQRVHNGFSPMSWEQQVAARAFYVPNDDMSRQHCVDPMISQATDYTNPQLLPGDNSTLHNFLILGRFYGFLYQCDVNASTDTMMLDTDHSDWHMVHIRAPKATESTTLWWDVPSLRTANELVLATPRVGFFSTMAFLAKWLTNSSNQMRVTANQTLIGALGMNFDGGDVTVPITNVPSDAQHAAPGTACYSCHKNLDPMRVFFQQAYTTGYGTQQDPNLAALQGTFATDGVVQSGKSLDDLGAILANHPAFAVGWTAKLCAYANSTPCDPTDPELLRIAQVFKQSNYNFKTLVRTLFSSPVVTGASITQTFKAKPMPASVVRANHLCQVMEARLGLTDFCGQKLLSRRPQSIIDLAASLPSDSVSRGQINMVTPSQASMFSRMGLELLCEQAALATTGDDAAMFSTQDVPQAIGQMVQQVMNLPDADARSVDAQTSLQAHFAAASAIQNVTPAMALQSTFVLACTSATSALTGF